MLCLYVALNSSNDCNERLELSRRADLRPDLCNKQIYTISQQQMCAIKKNCQKKPTKDKEIQIQC